MAPIFRILLVAICLFSSSLKAESYKSAKELICKDAGSACSDITSRCKGERQCEAQAIYQISSLSLSCLYVKDLNCEIPQFKEGLKALDNIPSSAKNNAMLRMCFSDAAKNFTGIKNVAIPERYIDALVAIAREAYPETHYHKDNVWFYDYKELNRCISKVDSQAAVKIDKKTDDDPRKSHVVMAYVCLATAIKVNDYHAAEMFGKSIKFIRKAGLEESKHIEYMAFAANEADAMKKEQLLSFFDSECSKPLKNIEIMANNGMLD